MPRPTISQAAPFREIRLCLALTLLAAAAWGAPARHTPVITLSYTTAETSTSALVVWNTNIASDSRIQFSTTSPVPADAPQLYSAAQVTYHEFALEGLSAGTFYYYKATSCAKRGCVTATGSFDTYPSCPDEVLPLSGAWERESSPNVGGVDQVRNRLLGVAALAADDVWAVGWSGDPAGPPYVQKTLIERFDGAWRLVPSPNPAGAVNSILYSVAGASFDDVWAVGASHDGTLPSRTLIEHWDGLQWTIVPSPSPDTQLNELRAVAVLSPTSAWAVGYRGGTHDETPLETLILRWNGASWSQVPSPNVPAGANQLLAITAISENDVWAVGYVGGGPLALHWNGAAWSVVPVNRDAGLSSDWLTGIAGTSSGDLWAVGQGKGVFTNQTFATLRHWNGVHWTDKVCRARSASNPPDGYEGGGPDAYFTGIAAGSSADVWAVGVAGSGPVILHWDGEAWTTATHPRAFPNSAGLFGVAATPDGNAWGVGFDIEVAPSGAASPERTLIDRYRP